jgi:hypothetical protein
MLYFLHTKANASNDETSVILHTKASNDGTSVLNNSVEWCLIIQYTVP